jgi:hypothetical protein
MASPTAPDYVSQVRGVLSDLRQDYIRKRQLDLEEQQQNAQATINFAQLANQRENQIQRNRIDELTLEQNRAQNLLELSKYQEAQDRQGKLDQMTKENHERVQAQYFDTLEKERQKKQQDSDAAALEQQFKIALAGNDTQRLAEVSQLMSVKILDESVRKGVIDNAYKALDLQRTLEQDNKNLMTAGNARDIASRLNLLNPKDYTVDGFTKEVDKISSEFVALGNTDPKVNEYFNRVQTSVIDRGMKFRESKIGSAIMNFTDLAEQKRLEPEYQKQYDELKANPANYTGKAVQGLAYQRNKAASVQALKLKDVENVALLDQITSINPALRGQDLSRLLPDLTPNESYDGNIDPDTGLLTEGFLKSQKTWEDDLRKPSFIMGPQISPVNQMLAGVLQTQGQPAQAQPAPAQPKGTEAAIRSRSRFDTAQAPGTVTVPTAPSSVSPETINAVVEAYNANPNGLYAGRPVREIIARLQARGVALPNLRTENVAGGQTQKR